MLHRIILTAASVVALTAAANAADMYRPAEGGYKDAPYIATNWGGFYVGANGGYAWGNDDATALSDTGGNHGTAPALRPDGGFGGGQIGYNWQTSRFVFGVEADIQGAGLSGSWTGNVISQPGNFNNAVTESQKVDYFGTVRGRLGYSFDRALVYGTGGLAYGGVKDAAVVNGWNIAGNQTQTGYTVGGGIEYKVAPKWTVKAEYQYINLGQVSLTETLSPAAITAKFDNQFSTVRVGVNYFVGGIYEPLK